MENFAILLRSSKPTSWVSEIVAAFRSLGGAARYDDLYEYIQRMTDRKLTAEWKATVRRTIEDHSSDSKNFRSDDLFRHLGQGFWSLREAGDVNALVTSRLSRKSKAVVDEVLDNVRPAEIEPKPVFVREHWRRWPSSRDMAPSAVILDSSIFAIIDGWVTDRHFELKLASGLILKVPLDWYPTLGSATRKQLSQVEFGEYGVHWPLLSFQVVIPEILTVNNSARAAKKDS